MKLLFEKCYLGVRKYGDYFGEENGRKFHIPSGAKYHIFIINGKSYGYPIISNYFCDVANCWDHLRQFYLGV